ncbi:MAG: Fic family protein, partial [Trebonia sp.]
MDSALVFAGDQPRQTLADRVRRGQLVRIATGVYSSEADLDPAVIVHRRWPEIVGHLYPGAVVTDRSAVTGGPVDGYLYLAHASRERSTELPGLTVRARAGPGPLDGDAPLPGGLYQAGKARALLENTFPSRARGGRPRRTLSTAELADWVDRLAMVDGVERLQRYRAAAELLAPTLAAGSEQVSMLSGLVGAALGTQRVQTGSAALTARQAGLPYDADRMRRFGVLINALRGSAPQNRPVLDVSDARYRYLPFYEAYFSNIIEGTVFELADAVAIVYEGAQIPGRADDSHDLLGTHLVVDDPAEMATIGRDADEFAQLLRARHATILAGRPDKNPGMFKEAANRAGNTSFVLPGLVAGTLRAGWSRLAELDTPFERAVYMTFLVSEVHPFADGNGRVARVMMNAELVTGGQSRIIVPTVFRDDYLDGLRMLSRQDEPRVLIKALRYVHDYTAQISWRTTELARQALEATNAFNEPNSPDRLILPRA